MLSKAIVIIDQEYRKGHGKICVEVVCSRHKTRDYSKDIAEEDEYKKPTYKRKILLAFVTNNSPKLSKYGLYDDFKNITYGK
jgi:hypothetical protein